jgi:cell volume regulation protein A
MYFTAENILLVGSGLILISILISKTGYRFGIPTLLLFLVVGMLFGSDGLGLQFNSVQDAQFIGMMALSIILFTGGMDTKFSDIRPVMTQGVILSTLGVVLTTALTGGFIFLLSWWGGWGIEMPLLTCLLLAATMASTDSASVFSLLRSQNINLKQNLRPMLELESGSNDPMAYMLTIVIIQIIGSRDSMDLVMVAKDLVVQFVVGGALGFAMGKCAVWLTNRINLLNSSLYPILLLSLVFITFTITDTIDGNGYLAVYICGLVVGNTKLVFRKEVNTFMNGLTWLFQIIMFITLGLLVNPHELLDVALIAVLVGLFMIVFARPISVFACLLPFKEMTNSARLFVSWVGLRGAVPIIFATYPVIAQVDGSKQIFNIVFFITLLSLVIQGMSITQMARWLKLDLPAEKEGNDFGVELPDEIDSQLSDMTLVAEDLAGGNRLVDLHLPKGQLVMIVKRGSEFLIPNGQMELKVGDKLLLITEGKNEKCPS